MEILLLVIHVAAAIAIVALVLLQHGKGADMGAAFGGGSSGSMFGASGSANFLSRSTAILATIFFLTSIALTVFVGKGKESEGVMNKAADPAKSESPASQVPVPSSVPAPVIPVPSAPAKPAELPK
ncbi:MAG: preprotein translocase subunit SecG [Betaproteobacteria bacterium]|jgi:preprotein translocase subunit SecG|nr:preprotein translocase subunit SecG [Betaproteobacteria bacterium]